ncbi:MAG: hypothetical protein ACTS7D_01365 [Candidatus Hodgkinia cicadicola]
MVNGFAEGEVQSKTIEVVRRRLMRRRTRQLRRISGNVAVYGRKFEG